MDENLISKPNYLLDPSNKKNIFLADAHNFIIVSKVQI